MQGHLPTSGARFPEEISRWNKQGQHVSEGVHSWPHISSGKTFVAEWDRKTVSPDTSLAHPQREGPKKFYNREISLPLLIPGVAKLSLDRKTFKECCINMLLYKSVFFLTKVFFFSNFKEKTLTQCKCILKNRNENDIAEKQTCLPIIQSLWLLTSWGELPPEPTILGFSVKSLAHNIFFLLFLLMGFQFASMHLGVIVLSDIWIHDK